ncbi:MAG: hypothetical protein R3F31_19355 [Verrucomicrobiales bacterium]
MTPNTNDLTSHGPGAEPEPEWFYDEEGRIVSADGVYYEDYLAALEGDDLASAPYYEASPQDGEIWEQTVPEGWEEYLPQEESPNAVFESSQPWTPRMKRPPLRKRRKIGTLPLGARVPIMRSRSRSRFPSKKNSRFLPLKTPALLTMGSPRQGNQPGPPNHRTMPTRKPDLSPLWPEPVPPPWTGLRVRSWPVPGKSEVGGTARGKYCSRRAVW